MHWRVRVIAPILAVVLGTTGGVATAIMTDHGGGGSIDDPLGAGAPLHNLPVCTGQSILVVGYGDSGAQLGNGISDNQALHPSYLETAHSCDTLLGPELEKTIPKYVAYLGPYTDPQTPCELRMTAAHRTDFVARLHAGNKTLVKCPCQLKTDAAPDLSLGMTETADDQVWIRSLQGMLHDYAVASGDGEGFTHDDISGNFDLFTQQYILKKFQVPAGYLSHQGNVDTETWRIMLHKVCSIYDY